MFPVGVCVTLSGVYIMSKRNMSRSVEEDQEVDREVENALQQHSVVIRQKSILARRTSRAVGIALRIAVGPVDGGSGGDTGGDVPMLAASAPVGGGGFATRFAQGRAVEGRGGRAMSTVDPTLDLSRPEVCPAPRPIYDRGEGYSLPVPGVCVGCLEVSVVPCLSHVRFPPPTPSRQVPEAMRGAINRRATLLLAAKHAVVVPQHAPRPGSASGKPGALSLNTPATPLSLGTQGNLLPWYETFNEQFNFMADRDLELAREDDADADADTDADACDDGDADPAIPGVARAPFSVELPGVPSLSVPSPMSRSEHAPVSGAASTDYSPIA